MNKRTTQRKSTKTVVRRSPKEEKLEPEPSRPRSKRTPARTTRRTKRKPASSTKMIYLAMSPKAANLLRALLGKARYDEPELDAIKDELESQL